MTITRRHIALQLRQELGLSMVEARQVVNHVFGDITSALGAGHRVKLHGFGVLEPVLRQARTGRNIGNGNLCAIPPRWSVRFKKGVLFQQEPRADKGQSHDTQA